MWQKLKNYYHLLQAMFASAYFANPSKHLKVIGVTGTDGKTTTVHMIHEILKAAGQKSSMISSVCAQIGKKSYDTGFHVTTPSPWQIQKFLKEARDSKSKYFILEATSHALDQNRLAFVDFEIAAVTNITSDHLDYHKTRKNYFAAKAKLFKNVNFSVLNKDDKSYDFLKHLVSGKILTYSAQGQDADFSKFKLEIKLKIPGHYNYSNAYAAAATATALKISKKIIIKSLNNFGGVIGRMEEIHEGQNFRIFVDFAHTANALENALQALQEIKNKNSKVIAVFGAAGKRDRDKRSKMGEASAKMADITIITAEDPRNESVGEISSEISRGLQKHGKKEGKDFFKIDDRKKAIESAFLMAKSGDVVGIFGKGHEKSLAFGNREYPWDELEEVKKAARERSKNE